MFSQASSEFNTYCLTHFFDISLEIQPTHKGNLQHTFYDILLVVLVSALCGLDKYSLMVQFANNDIDWFKKHGDFINGISCRETIRRFLVALDSKAFQACYLNWLNLFNKN